MYIGGLKEESPRIPIKGLEPEILSSLLDYSYTSKLTINQDNVINMLVGAEMLQFWEVTEFCSQFIKNQLQPENCLEFKHFAKTHNESDLVSHYDSYILEHFGEIVKQEEFLKVNKEDLLFFIASDKIGLESEEQVFECIFSWIDHDKSVWSGFFQEFMEHIRFSNISSEYLRSNTNLLG